MRASEIILKTLGVKRVAAWCAVSEQTPYQWLVRGTEEHPIPLKYVPAIVRGARAEGMSLSFSDLWPAASDLSTPEAEENQELAS